MPLLIIPLFDYSYEHYLSLAITPVIFKLKPKLSLLNSGIKGKETTTWFPALIVAPSAAGQVKIDTKDDYLIRSFKDGRQVTSCDEIFTHVTNFIHL